MSDKPPPPERPRPSPTTAFVVHLTEPGIAEGARAGGRVEHVSSGRTAHFESAEGLLHFMRQTLAIVQDDCE
jgi:hypothetical protein